jgi:hypothetical protein
MIKSLKKLVLLLILGITAASCEKAASGPREVYATIETKKVGDPQSLFFVTIYDQTLSTLGGAGVTGSDSPTKVTGQAFDIPEGTQLKIIGELINASGTNNVFWCDVVVKVFINDKVKWSKRYKEGEVFSPAFETIVVN